MTVNEAIKTLKQPVVLGATKMSGKRIASLKRNNRIEQVKIAYHFFPSPHPPSPNLRRESVRQPRPGYNACQLQIKNETSFIKLPHA